MEKPRLREGDTSSEHPCSSWPMLPAGTCPHQCRGQAHSVPTLQMGWGFPRSHSHQMVRRRSNQMPGFRSLTLSAHLPPGEQSLSDNRDSTGQCALRKHRLVKSRHASEWAQLLRPSTSVMLRSSFLTPASGGPSATPYTFASDPPLRLCLVPGSLQRSPCSQPVLQPAARGVFGNQQ